MMRCSTSSTTWIVVVASATALLVLNRATSTFAQDFKLCRCTAKFERFYDRRSLMQQRQQEEIDRSLGLKIYPYDYKDYFIDKDGYYIVEGLRVLPNDDLACDVVGSKDNKKRPRSGTPPSPATAPYKRDGILEKVFGHGRSLFANGEKHSTEEDPSQHLRTLTSNRKGKVNGGMKRKRKGKGKQKGKRCKASDISPECLPIIFPCPTNSAPVQPPETITDVPTTVPLEQIQKCADGSIGPNSADTCVDICPDDVFLEQPFGCLNACPVGVPATGNCVTVCESGSNSIPSGCREACCPKQYCPYDGSIAPSDPGNCAVLCPDDGSFFDGCRTKCPIDGSTRPNNCVDVCTGAPTDAANCEEACCSVEQPSTAPSQEPSFGPSAEPSAPPSEDVPSSSPTKIPTKFPTVTTTLSPFITPPNSTCVLDQGNVTCFCDPGFSGDPLTGCIGLPEVRLTGVDTTTFNALNSTICFVIFNDEFKVDNTSLEVMLSNSIVPMSLLTIAADKVCLVDPLLSQNSANDFRIKAVAAGSGINVSSKEIFWVGSESATISVVNANGTQALQQVTVTARLADDASVTAKQVGSSATFVFGNLPLRTIIYDAVAADGSAGASALAGSGLITIELLSFDQPSTIDNNDLSLGTSEGWLLKDESVASIVPHQENVGPNTTENVGRRLEEVSNKDFRLMTESIGSQTVSRTFETKAGTTGVRIRYRFETSEFPQYYLTQYNDFFKVSIRSKKVGGYKSEANSMNGLGADAFGVGSVYPSTNWREVILPVASDGDTIQVDVTVANVGDGAVDSYVYIDFVEELTQGLCIYSNILPNETVFDGHAALAFYSREGNNIELSTYGLWPDFNKEVTDNGNATDIRVNLTSDMVSDPYYKYFYCEAINDKQKDVLNGLVTKNVKWTCTYSCASFASDTFYAVTGTEIDNDDILGFDTPRKITKSILQLNAGSSIPREGLPWTGFMRRNRHLQSGELRVSSFPDNFVTTCISSSVF